MNKVKCALLIDDDGTANFINEKVIMQLGFAEQIEMAINGEKALNFVQFYADNNDGMSPELILLDLKMPVLDGYDFLEYFFRKSLTNKEKVKIIILSAYPDDKAGMLLTKYPQTHLMIKPLTEDKLIEVLLS